MDKENEIKEQQRQTWNKFSAGWKKWDKFVLNWLQPVGEKLLQETMVKDGYTIMDIATGTGEPGLTAAARFPKSRVVGIDLAENMVDIAKDNAVKRKVKNYEAIVHDISDIPYESDYFDAILCRFGVMFFPDPERCLDEMMRVLKPGGKIAMSSWAQQEKNDWATTIGKIVHDALEMPPPSPDAPGIFRFSQPGMLAALLENSGFRSVRESEISGHLVFDSPEQYWDFMTSIAAPITNALGKADEKTQERVRSMVMESAIKKTQNGRVVFNWCSWIASGTR